MDRITTTIWARNVLIGQLNRIIILNKHKPATTMATIEEKNLRIALIRVEQNLQTLIAKDRLEQSLEEALDEIR